MNRVWITALIVAVIGVSLVYFLTRNKNPGIPTTGDDASTTNLMNGSSTDLQQSTTTIDNTKG